MLALPLAALWMALPATAARSAEPAPTLRSTPMQQATGEFDVQMKPQAEDKAPGATRGRFTLEKTFRGALQGTGRGEMLTAMSETPGSAAYVAIERVEGVLDGRRGTFVLVHRGTMTRGAQALSVDVVPDSGTGELAGIEGSLAIEIRDRKHFYTLNYRLPESTR
jgi:hypothetical protein